MNTKENTIEYSLRLAADLHESGQIETASDIRELAELASRLHLALMDLAADAEAMDKRLLVGQPAPGCHKGSISRARAILSEL